MAKSFFFKETKPTFFSSGDTTINSCCHPDIIFDTVADLPANGGGFGFGFVPDGGGGLLRYVYDEATDTWNLDAAAPGASTVVTTATEAITSTVGQTVFPITANGGNTTGASVKGILFFRNGVLLDPNEFTVAAGSITIAGTQPATTADDVFFVQILNAV